MATSRTRGRPPHRDVLTPAEWRVLELVRHGLGRRAIATRLGTTDNAVKYHLANIRTKLGVRRLEELRRFRGVAADSALAKGRPAMTSQERRPPDRLDQVSLLCRDVERSTRFYVDVLGLPHLGTYGDLVFFEMGGVRLYLHRTDDEGWRPGSGLYFVTEDVHRRKQELEAAGVTFTSAPHLIHRDQETGEETWMAFFEDPDGNVLALTQRVTP